MAIIQLTWVSKKLCAKIVGDLKQDVVLTLILLEHESSPSFFDVMTPLLVHLMEEL
jgi:hypothetical protein